MKRLILFTTAYCEPCKAFKPIFNEIARKRLDVCFEVLDATTSERERVEYKIRTVPTIILLDNDELIGKKIHPSTKEDISELLELIG